MDMKTSPLALLKDAGLLKTDSYINGAWVGAEERFAVTDPATGLELVKVARHGAAQAEAAIAAANAALPAWRARPAKERSALLMKWFQLLVA
ncbi:MAG: succinate-semialdehyde dehydrogenase, partial [Pseudomonadota bacterium]